MRRILIAVITAFLAVGSLQTPAQAVITTYTNPNILADLNPTTAWDSIAGAVEFNGALYYSGFSPRYGQELRRINSAGISELAYDINPNGDSSPFALIAFKDKLYFYSQSSDGITYLYSFSAEGVLAQVGVVATDFSWLANNSSAVYNNKLYMYRYNQGSADSGWQVWQFDGTTFSLTPVPTHDRQGYLGTQSMAVVNNKLYLSMPVTGDSFGTALGVIDSTGIAVRPPNTTGMRNPEQFIAIGNRVAFRSEGPAGTEVYVYDGSSAPVAMNVASDSSSIQSSQPSGLFVFKNMLYFNASQQSGIWEFWRTDGLSQPTRFLGGEFVEGQRANATPLTVYKNRMYLMARQTALNEFTSSLYSTDGTTIRKETAFSLMMNPWGVKQYVFGGKLYVTGVTGAGYRLYAFDGSTAQEVEHSDYSTGDGYQDPWVLSSFGSTSSALYFGGYSGEHPGVYRFNGTTTPTLVQGSEGLIATTILSIGDTVYVAAEPENALYQDISMYKINGSGQLERMDNLCDALGNNPMSLIETMGAGTLFVSYQSIVFMSGNTLHKMDTSNFGDLDTGVVIGDYYYFMISTDQGKKVYRWDGTTAPTLYSEFGYLGLNTSPLLKVNGELFWIGDLGGGYGLHKISPSGSDFVDFVPGINNTYVSEMVSVGAATYISSYDYEAGLHRLWKLTATGATAMPAVAERITRVSGLSVVLGNLVVTGTNSSGIYVSLVVESDGSVSKILNSNVSFNQSDSGTIGGFNGEYYFPYNHPEFGLELATTGSGVSAVVPCAPTNLAAGVATDSSVALSWSAPSNSGGQPLSTYVVEYSKDGSTWKNFYHPASTLTSIVATGLDFNTTYQFRVKARTVKGNSIASSTVSKKTLVYRPGAVRSLQVKATGITKNSAKVTWLAPSVKGSGRITDYKVETSTNGKKWTVVKRTATASVSITLTKLKSKTKYYVRVTPISTAGNGPTSSKVLFKTK
ncbi:MAG: hypothetical protein RL410_1010 [Actinomycetota bacterium]